MRKTKFTKYQIVNILKAVEGGIAVKDARRENSISSAAYYKWKSKYGGMEASDVQRMRDLEAGNPGTSLYYVEAWEAEHCSPP